MGLQSSDLVRREANIIIIVLWTKTGSIAHSRN
jgi:hypothetical protein